LANILTGRYSMSAPRDLPQKAKPGAAPHALLDTAFHVFATRGYRAVRLEEVAEAAGMTKGAIYYYFDSKEDLLRRALQHRHRDIFAEISEALAAERGPASAKIRFVLRKVWLRWSEPGWGHAFRLIVGEVSVEFPAIFRMWAEEGPIQGWELVRALIEGGWARRSSTLLLAIVIGDAAIFAAGLAWLAMYVPPGEGLLAAGLLPFLPGEAAKILLAALALRRVRE